MEERRKIKDRRVEPHGLNQPLYFNRYTPDRRQPVRLAKRYISKNIAPLMRAET